MIQMLESIFKITPFIPMEGKSRIIRLDGTDDEYINEARRIRKERVREKGINHTEENIKLVKTALLDNSSAFCSNGFIGVTALHRLTSLSCTSVRNILSKLHDEGFDGLSKHEGGYYWMSSPAERELSIKLNGRPCDNAKRANSARLVSEALQHDGAERFMNGEKIIPARLRLIIGLSVPTIIKVLYQMSQGEYPGLRRDGSYFFFRKIPT